MEFMIYDLRFRSRTRFRRAHVNRKSPIVNLIVAAVLLTPVVRAANSNSVVRTNAPPLAPEPAPITSREFFNAGSRKLREGKLREAEAFLQGALSRQDGRV